MYTRRTLSLMVPAMALLAGAACSISKTPAQQLTGPSELSLSLAVTANPDIITANGLDYSDIMIVARDVNGQPIEGRQLRVDVVNDSDQIIQVGTLSTQRVTTDHSGEAKVRFVAPMQNTPSVDNNPPAKIRVLPVSTGLGAELARYVSIRLVPQTVVLVPGAPIPRFEFSPTSPTTNQDVFFDASKSYDTDGSIVSYTWDFGDGTKKGPFTIPTSSHDFGVAKTYYVQLTVKDNAGQESNTYQQVVVK
jgi:PKD repeat protein